MSVMISHTLQDGRDEGRPGLSASLLQSTVINSDLAKELIQRESVTASRSVLHVEEEHVANNLTASTLVGLGMIPEPPYVFADDAKGSLVAFYHVGCRLAGHAGLVHGGVISMLLDECMGRACFPKLVGRIAVTAKLDIAFKAPMKVDSVIVIRATTNVVEGRKAWVDGVVEDVAETKTIATANALFVEPKWSNEMSKLL